MFFILTNYHLYKKILIVVAISDNLQYLGGNILKFGKYTPKPFSISPNKSVGGYLFPLVILLYQFNYEIILSIFLGYIGDLSISYFKRNENIKDCGYLLRSHGGFLDRYDGIHFAFTIMSILNYY